MNARRTLPTRYGDRGASLVIALAVMLALGGILGGLVTFINSSTAVSLGLQATRNRQYAADAAIEQAIRTVQDDATSKALVGAFCSVSQPFFVSSASINGYNTRVDCQGAPSAVLD